MEAALKTLWGASAWPFATAVKDACETAAHEETLRRLEQCIAVHSSGVLHGPNGVGKSRLEMEDGLEVGIRCFNVESASELEKLNEVACAHGVRAPISL